MSDLVVESPDRYSVLVDHFGRAAVWPAGRPRPAGWEAITGETSEADCLAYLGEVGLGRPIPLAG